MVNKDPDDSLPPGWRREVIVRKKNGRKEKVVFQRVEPEGLPPGWIKELKITKSGHKVRKDPYYIDPVSGYIFRSMKDVVRYLETGELGRLAYKPKDKGSLDEHDSENDKDNSPTAVKKQKIGDAESSSPEVKDSMKVDEWNNSDSILCPSTPVLEVMAIEKRTVESGDIEDETKKSKPGSKSDKKKVLDLPRRSSKRLAGVALDPTPELKTTRARRPVAKQSGDELASTVAGVALDPTPESKITAGARQAVAKRSGDKVTSTVAGVALNPTPESKTTTGARRAVAKQSGDEVPNAVEVSKSREDSQESSMSKCHSGDLANLSKNADQIKGKYGSGKNRGFAGDLPPQDQAKVETGCEVEAKPKPESSLDLPFGDLLSDPCIAFAIKTLTGDNFETSVGIEASVGPSNITSEGITIPKANNCDQKQNLAIPGQPAVNIIENSSETDEKPGLPIDSPFADILTDPCIEFAIKTLTGSIPVGSGADTLDYFPPPQQHNPPQTQSSKNFCQTEFLSQQYNVLEKPVTREQGHARSLNMQKSGAAAGLRQPGDNRFNECH